MRAAVLRTQPGSLEVCDLSVDVPGPHEVLIRTAACGLCRSDLHAAEGTLPVPVPCVLGHEAAGRIAAVGRAVTEFRVGDHVVACLVGFCGHCEFCIAGKPFRCSNRPRGTTRPDEGVSSELGRSREAGPALRDATGPVAQFVGLGGLAQRMLVHERFVVSVPREMPLDRAALLGCGVTTGVGAVLNTARVPAGSTVAVIGCGGVGLNTVQGARLAGAARIVAIDAHAGKLDLALRFGATDIIDAREDDPVERVIALTRGGVDFAFEALGSRPTAEQALAMVKDAGTATIVGVGARGTAFAVSFEELVARGKRLQGSSLGSSRFRVDVPVYADLYLQGRLELDALISARIPLEDVNQGLAAIETGELARSVVVFDET